MSETFAFFEGATTQNQEPRITVRRGGQIVLTPGAVRLLGDDVTHVQIGFNAKTRTVGIRPTSDTGRGRYRLRTPKSGQSRLVDGKGFFRHLGLHFEKAQSFDAQKFDHGIVGFHLSEEKASDAAPTASQAMAKKGSRRTSRAAS